MHRDRPWASDGDDRRPFAEPGDGAVRTDLYGEDEPGRCGALSGADADRDGRHECRGWADDAATSGVDPEPQPGGVREVWAGQGRGHSVADRVCARAEAAALEVWQ